MLRPVHDRLLEIIDGSLELSTPEPQSAAIDVEDISRRGLRLELERPLVIGFGEVILAQALVDQGGQQIGPDTRGPTGAASRQAIPGLRRLAQAQVRECEIKGGAEVIGLQPQGLLKSEDGSLQVALLEPFLPQPEVIDHAGRAKLLRLPALALSSGRITHLAQETSTAQMIGRGRRHQTGCPVQNGQRSR